MLCYMDIAYFVADDSSDYYVSHCYAHATPVFVTKPWSPSIFYEGFDRCCIAGVGVMLAQGCMWFADICFVNF